MLWYAENVRAENCQINKTQLIRAVFEALKKYETAKKLGNSGCTGHLYALYFILLKQGGGGQENHF